MSDADVGCVFALVFFIFQLSNFKMWLNFKNLAICESSLQHHGRGGRGGSVVFRESVRKNAMGIK